MLLTFFFVSTRKMKQTWVLLLLLLLGTAYSYRRNNIFIALQGKATQSSLYGIGIPYNAIDGNRNGNWDQASCIHTKKDFTPWWRLDQRKTHKVFSVNITNRDIRVGDSLDNNGNNNPRCDVISSIHAGFTQSFQCNGMDGRYVNVVIPGRAEYLTLCEVEVYDFMNILFPLCIFL
uniref:Fucolectin tachylectin-4 pentraxin-1 domain-containing protein n=1 Tax=Anabas testudineus TaxID=64144 RepID=A0A3Q1H4U0_ANATE